MSGRTIKSGSVDQYCEVKVWTTADGAQQHWLSGIRSAMRHLSKLWWADHQHRRQCLLVALMLTGGFTMSLKAATRLASPMLLSQRLRMSPSGLCSLTAIQHRARLTKRVTHYRRHFRRILPHSASMSAGMFRRLRWLIRRPPTQTCVAPIRLILEHRQRLLMSTLPSAMVQT